MATWEKKLKSSTVKPAKKASPPSKVSGALAKRAAAGKKLVLKIVTDDKPYKYPAGFKAPKSLAVAADTFYTMRNKRLETQREAAAMEVNEKAVKHWLIETLPKKNASGIAGSLARVAIDIKDIPVATSWPEIYAHIVAVYNEHKRKKTGLEDSAFALLNKALSDAEVKSYWERGEPVPGVGVMHIPTLSLNKL